MKFWAFVVILAVATKGEQEGEEEGTTQALVFQPDGRGSDQTYAVLNNPSSVVGNFSDLSFCIRLQLYFYKPSIVYIFESGPRSNLSNGKPRNEGDESYDLQFSITPEGPWVGVKNHAFLVETKVSPLEWHHFCFSLAGETITMVQNGRVVFNVTNLKFMGEANFRSEFLNNLIVGQRQGTLRDPILSFSGEIRDLNFWDHPLATDELKGITGCKIKRARGNLVDWTNQQWNLHQVELRTVPRHDCTHSNTLVMFPERRVYEKSRLLCEVFGGKVAIPETEHSKMVMYNISIANFSVCNRRQLEYLWLGMTDAANEGEWLAEGQDRPVAFSSGRSRNLPWEQRPLEPNGGTKENCAAMKRGRTWLDVQCSFKLCSVCNFTDPPRLRLRGLCRESSFDDHYTLKVNDYTDGRHGFRGYYGSTIEWDKGNRYWRLSTLQDSHVYAYNNISKDYPLGRHVWYFVNESCLLNSFQMRRLKLTTCKDNEFTCNDGTCIKMAGRCDQKRDCKDYSDESACKLISLDKQHYIKDYAPLSDSENLTTVTISVELLSLDDIRELGMTFDVQFRLTMSWYDPRLRFHNLKTEDTLNTLTVDEKQQIWIPHLIFNNTDDEHESVLDSKTTLKVTRKGNYTLSSVQNTDEKYIFSGLQNPLTYSRHHNIEFQCAFDMTFYPFDVQRCYMVFLRNKNAGNFQLKKRDMDALIYLGERELMQYHIAEWKLLDETDSAGLVIEITLRRRYLYQLLTTYLPSLCLFLIIHATQYFKISYFHTRIMVSLTGMLVMTTLFLNTSSGLPKTSYFKMIDIWMVFGLLLPFLEVVLHTVTEYRRKEDNGEQSLLLRIKGGRVHSIPYNDDNEAEQQIAQTTSNLRIPGDDGHKKQQTAALLSPPPPSLIAPPAPDVVIPLHRKRLSRLLHCVKMVCVGRDTADPSEITKHISRTVVPILVIIFNLVYWTIAFLHG